MLARVILAILVGAAAALADPSPLVSGDPLACFNRIDGAGTLTNVAVTGMPFLHALHVKTGTVPATANAWDIRPRCFSTLAARQNDVVAVAFWMRTIAAPDGTGLTSFVLERNDSPYTKSVTYTAAAGSDWKLFEVPFTMAETYSANAYNLSFWVTFPNQEIEIGGFRNFFVYSSVQVSPTPAPPPPPPRPANHASCATSPPRRMHPRLRCS